MAFAVHAQALAGELRAEGRTAEARALCERALATLRTAPIGSGLFNEYSSAQFELLRGSTFTDENRPKEAEQAYLEGEKRLSAIEQRIADARSASADPELASQVEAQLRMVRAKRGDALLSLAVNANVRMGDKARALEYFERAYALARLAWPIVIDDDPSISIEQSTAVTSASPTWPGRWAPISTTA